MQLKNLEEKLLEGVENINEPSVNGTSLGVIFNHYFSECEPLEFKNGLLIGKSKI